MTLGSLTVCRTAVRAAEPDIYRRDLVGQFAGGHRHFRSPPGGGEPVIDQMSANQTLWTTFLQHIRGRRLLSIAALSHINDGFKRQI